MAMHQQTLQKSASTTLKVKLLEHTLQNPDISPGDLAVFPHKVLLRALAHECATRCNNIISSFFFQMSAINVRRERKRERKACLECVVYFAYPHLQ